VVAQSSSESLFLCRCCGPAELRPAGTDPGFGIRYYTGSGMELSYQISDSLATLILKFFVKDPGSRFFRPWILDGKILIQDSGETSRIRNTVDLPL